MATPLQIRNTQQERGNAMNCVNCDEPIKFAYVYGDQGYWTHPDRIDLGDNGQACPGVLDDQAYPDVR